MTLHHTRYRHAHDRAIAHADARLGAIVPALLDGTIEWGHTRPSRAHHTRDALLHRPGREPLPVTASLAYGTTLPELLHEQNATIVARMAAAHDRASHETAHASAHRAVLVMMDCSAPAVLALQGPVVVAEHAPAAATLASELLDAPHRLVDHLDRLWGSLAPLRLGTAANRMAAASLTKPPRSRRSSPRPGWRIRCPLTSPKLAGDGPPAARCRGCAHAWSTSPCASSPAQRGLAERATEVLDLVEHIAPTVSLAPTRHRRPRWPTPLVWRCAHGRA